MPPRHALAILALLALFPGRPGRANPAAGPGEVEPPAIEVAFVLDATGSMGPYIEEARRRIASIAEDLAAGEPAPRVRYALISYRDRGDEYVTRVEAFTDSIALMQERLEGTAAGGGGDHPEAVFEGVAAAVRQLSWSKEDDSVLRLLYLVGDAPAKDYGLTEDGLAREAMKRGIVIHTIACGGGELPQFDLLARLTEGRSLRLADPHRGGAAITGGSSTAPAATGSLAEAVTGTARAYSSSVGVDYERSRATALETRELGAAALARSGLLGAHVRWVRDPIAWGDLWAAHTSLLPEAERPPVPAVDFSTHHVLLLGGHGAGLAATRVERAGDRRRATIEPRSGGGVSFVLVPVAKEGGSR